MLSKEQIVEIIESDNDYNENGRFRRDFIDGLLAMCYEYTFLKKLRTTLAFSEKRCEISIKTLTITVTVIGSDNTHLLVKETRVDKDGETVEFWLLNQNSLIGDVVWRYMD